MATRCITKNCLQLSHSTSSSAARAFLQLSPRRYLHRTPLPELDFLLPGIPSSILRNGCTSRPTSRTIQVEKRRFTSSSRRQQTTAVFNPRRDEDGNDMNVEITPRASNVSLTSCLCYISVANTKVSASKRNHVSRFKSQPCTSNTS